MSLLLSSALFLVASATPMQADTLIAPGKVSPDFTLMRPDGSPLDLYKAAKPKKATIVNFWFYH